MIDYLYRKFVFNIQENKMSKRKKMFKSLTIGLAVSAGWAFLGHVLNPWAVQWLLAGLYVMGLFLIWATTRVKKPCHCDEEQKLI